MNHLTLVCFPHAGADASTYQRLATEITRQEEGFRRITVKVVNLPGRGRRYAEDLSKINLDGLVDDALAQMEPWISAGHYALLGHSMGSWLAYLAAQRLRETGRPLPCRLIVSGSRPPRLGVIKVLHSLDQASLIDELRSMGGFPQELLENLEALDYFLPILRADLEAMASYNPRQYQPLPVPVTAYRGVLDTVSREDAMAWRDETSHSFNFHEFAGNHFFVLHLANEVAAVTRKMLLEPESPRRIKSMGQGTSQDQGKNSRLGGLVMPMPQARIG
jgi:surfactin synthase thioesterase subunit